MAVKIAPVKYVSARPDHRAIRLAGSAFGETGAQTRARIAALQKEIVRDREAIYAKLKKEKNKEKAKQLRARIAAMDRKAKAAIADYQNKAKKAAHKYQQDVEQALKKVRQKLRSK